MNNAHSHTHSESSTFAFAGGLFFTMLDILKQLLETAQMTFPDIFKAMVVGMVGAIFSGFGAWLFKTFIRKQLDRLVKKLRRENP